MPQDIADRSAPAPADANASTLLSNDAFSYPDQFLEILQRSFSGITHNSSDIITRDEVSAFEKTARQPEEKLAAEIAMNHFDQLQRMPNDALDLPADPKKGISLADLDIDIDLVDGDKLPITRQAPDAIENTMFTILSGTAAVVGAMHGQPQAVLAGAIALGLGATLYGDYQRYFHINHQIDSIIHNDEQMVKSWL